MSSLIILIIAVGVFAPGVVTLLGRELFYLLAAPALIAAPGWLFRRSEPVFQNLAGLHFL